MLSLEVGNRSQNKIVPLSKFSFLYPYQDIKMLIFLNQEILLTIKGLQVYKNEQYLLFSCK